MAAQKSCGTTSFFLAYGPHVTKKTWKHHNATQLFWRASETLGIRCLMLLKNWQETAGVILTGWASWIQIALARIKYFLLACFFKMIFSHRLERDKKKETPVLSLPVLVVPMFFLRFSTKKKPISGVRKKENQQRPWKRNLHSKENLGERKTLRSWSLSQFSCVENSTSEIHMF